MTSKNVPGEKTKRPDVSKRMVDNKFTLETVVKGSLHNYIRGNDNVKAIVQQEINSRVELYSKRITKASLMINIYIRHLLHTQKQKCLENTSKSETYSYLYLPPYILDQTFIRQCMLGKDGCRIHYSDFDAFRQEKGYLDDIEINERNIGDRNIYSHGARKYITNAQNHLILNFDSFLNKYLYNISLSEYAHEPFFKDLVFFTRSKIHNWEKIRILEAYHDRYDVREKVDNVVNQFRSILGCKKDDILGKKWMQENLIHILEMYAFILEEIENYNLRLQNDKEFRKTIRKKRSEQGQKGGDCFIKLFHLLPVHTIKAHFLPIDNDVFEGLYKSIRKYDVCRHIPELPSDWKTDEKKDMFWDTIFRIRKLEGHYHKFSHHVSTDGYAIDFHYKRPIAMKENFVKEISTKLQKVKDKYQKKEAGVRKTKKSKTQEDEEKEIIKEYLQDKRVLGLDPGRVTIIHIAEDANGEIRSYKLSRCHYYRKSGIMRSRKLTETWIRKNKEYKKGISELNENSLKTMIEEKMCNCIAVYKTYWNVFWEERMKMRWRCNNFNLYKGKKSVFSQFFNRIDKDNVEKKDTVISYGSARFSPMGKGELACPTSRAYKECASRYATFIVNEFRSTIVKYKDNVRLHHIKEIIKDEDGKTRLAFKGDVRGLLWFSHQKKNKLIDRDLNAALNIRQFLLNGSYTDAIFTRDVKFSKEMENDKIRLVKRESEDMIQKRISKIQRLKRKKSSNEKSCYTIVKK